MRANARKKQKLEYEKKEKERTVTVKSGYRRKRKDERCNRGVEPVEITILLFFFSHTTEYGV